MTELSALRDAVDNLQRSIEEKPSHAAANLTALQSGLLGDLQETLSLIRDQDASGPLTLQDSPLFLRERFISHSGKFFAITGAP